jgi:hypothetical protein
MRTVMAVAALAAMINLSAPFAGADPFSKAWSCAKAAGMTQVSIGKDLYKKGEALAANGPEYAYCLGKAGPEAQVLAITTSAITAVRLASPGMLPKGGKCPNTLKGVATKPFASGIGALLPSGGFKTKLIEAARSDVAADQVWAQIDQLPPPFGSIGTQIDCGCLLSDGALTLTDISEVTTAVAKASSKCGDMLDEVGLGFVNDAGKYALKLGKEGYGAVSGAVDEVIGGQSDPEPAAEVFRIWFGDHVQWHAEQMALYPTTWSTKPMEVCSNPSWPAVCPIRISDAYSGCVSYYDNHKHSKSSGQKICGQFRDVAMAAAQKDAAKLKSQMDALILVQQLEPLWRKNDWDWRFPAKGASTSDPTKIVTYDPSAESHYGFRDIFGEMKVNQSPKVWLRNVTGVYVAARNLAPSLNNNPTQAVDLAYASVWPSLQNVVRVSWKNHASAISGYEAQKLFPTPAFGFTYGCPQSLEKACVSLVNDTHQKECLPQIVDVYVTSPTQEEIYKKLIPRNSVCRAKIDPVIARAGKLNEDWPKVIQDDAAKCNALADQPMREVCHTKLNADYLDCAEIALKKGKDSAATCFGARQLGTEFLKGIQGPKGPQSQPGAPAQPPPSNAGRAPTPPPPPVQPSEPPASRTPTPTLPPLFKRVPITPPPAEGPKG